MKLISPEVTRIEEHNPYKLVERIGRVCYKSEDRITEDSCYKFVEGLIKRQHFAMLEHARITFHLRGWRPHLPTLVNIPGVLIRDLTDFEQHPEYLINVSMSHIYNPKWRMTDGNNIGSYFEIFQKLLEAKYNPFAEDYEHDGVSIAEHINVDEFKFTSLHFICDRGVSHELVRHRAAIAQTSTRYCNYTLDKFGGEIEFVTPANYGEWDDMSKLAFENSCNQSEVNYFVMIENGRTPQEARAVLTNALKTEVILTMNKPQWKHFLNLRLYGTTGAPHPDMKVVASLASHFLP